MNHILTRYLTHSARKHSNTSFRRGYSSGDPQPWWQPRKYGKTGGGHHEDRNKKSIDRRIQNSKAMSYLLRHGAKERGLPMRSDGFVRVKDLLKTAELRHLSFLELEKIVQLDNKKRFTLSYNPAAEGTSNQADNWWIRANQGHSMNSVVDLELKRITTPDEVPMAVHGTSPNLWDKISVEGLSRMTRNHIHLAQGVARGDVISGMRSSARLLIYIDLTKAMAAGLKFYLSANGVILTEGDEQGYIRPQFFRRVETLRKKYVPISGWEGPEGAETSLKDFVQDTTEQEARRNLDTTSLQPQQRADDTVPTKPHPQDEKKTNVPEELALL